MTAPSRFLSFLSLALVGALALLFAAPSAYALEKMCPYQGQNQDIMVRVLHVDSDTIAATAARQCQNIGKMAFNAYGPDQARAMPLGVIQDVAWAHAGDVITLPGQTPRTARFTGFVYIIGPGGVSPEPFTRWANDIEVR